ncbi:YraN family protein, partial [Candidatus Saccharibacteria bacterium]|nr:YraN family protein [Candidatus Saccharibacteria bacterium]
LGSLAEDWVAGYLLQKGYKILARNYGKKYFEVDIIGLKGQCLCFVEVKYRRNPIDAEPIKLINKRKISQIKTGGLTWLKYHPEYLTSLLRIDLVTVVGEIGWPKITHYLDISS